MNQDLSIVTLVLQASFVVQVVMVGLLLTSLASWTVIFGKLFGLRRVRAENDEFEREFWAGKNLTDLYNDAIKRVGYSAPMERIFASGMREFLKLRERKMGDSGALLAYAMNGEPLPLQHGYPLRVIVPGWYAVTSVKCSFPSLR